MASSSSPPEGDLKVVVVDYQAGNLRSVVRALERMGARPEVSDSPREVMSADALVLPGVGAGDAAIEALRSRGLVEPLREFAASGRPFLGVCLGLQLLMDATDEGDVACLGVVRGRTRRLPPGRKVPHMGWNLVDLRGEHPALKGMPSRAYFYFVHSYYAEPEDSGLVLGVTEYGVEFCSVLGWGNVLATQFHPEKSGPLGLAIYGNFLEHAALVAAGG